MNLLKEHFPDFSVLRAPVPAALDGVVTRGALWQAAGKRFLLEVPGVGRYLVEDGSSITVDTEPAASERSVDYFMGMLPLASLAYQRGLLAFHAAAVSNGHDVLLLAGDSGSGKSTLLAGLLRCGWKMLADDLALVGLDSNDRPVVYPVRFGIALWSSSLDKLGISAETLQYCDANRQLYSHPEQFTSTPLSLRGIYRMGVHIKNEVQMDEVVGSDRFKAIGAMQYNSHVADALCDRAAYLRGASAIASKVAFRNLRRPRGAWSLDSLVDVITNLHADSQ